MNYKGIFPWIYCYFWQARAIWNFLLVPISWVYYSISLIKYHIFHNPKKLKKPIICVGNITVGGAGKTETALALGRLCLKMGLKPSFAVRGYKGSLSSHTKCVKVDKSLHSSCEVGDEALLLSAVAPTYISKNRLLAAEAASLAAGIVILDDGMQNNSLYKDLVLMVVNAHYKFGNGLLMPAGPLRETLGQALLKSAAIIIAHGAWQDSYSRALEEINENLYSSLAAKPTYSLMSRVMNQEVIQEKEYIALAGIANPENFLKTLIALKVKVVKSFVFPDHHFYSRQELDPIFTLANSHKIKVITTEKDKVRIPTCYHEHVMVVEIISCFSESRELEQIIQKLLIKNKSIKIDTCLLS